MSKKGFFSKLLSSSNELTLTELQKEIYRTENKVVKLNTEAGRNQAEIDEENRKIAKDKEALEQRLQMKICSFG